MDIRKTARGGSVKERRPVGQSAGHDPPILSPLFERGAIFSERKMNDTVILLVSGDERCAERLPRGGFSVRRSPDAERAVSLAEKERIDIIVIDSSLDALRILREKFAFPIIMLSAGDSEAERIAALMLGADDVLSRPFGAQELTARIRSQLRRTARGNSPSAESAEPSEIAVDKLRINILTHKCFLDSREIRLTPFEFNILWYLCLHRGRVVSSEELFEAVWGEKYLDSSDTVMPHIARLRRKLGEPAKAPRYIKTIWGVGYTVG